VRRRLSWRKRVTLRVLLWVRAKITRLANYLYGKWLRA
jgi:hypothetical protein